MEKVIPDKLTKKILFEIYYPMPERTIRYYVNSYILELGKNVRIRILPDMVKLNIFIIFGVPNGYRLSESLQMKFDKLKSMREKGC